MNKSKLILTINTIKYLKFKQIRYRIYYILRNRLVKKSYSQALLTVSSPLNWRNSFNSQESLLDTNTFKFLNITHEFDEIDWNYSVYGKLWTYNLNYFDFLLQEDISKDQGLHLINEFIKKKSNLKDGLEPYPISLRGINWIKFLSVNKVKDHSVDTFLYQDYQRLLDNLEYHILANHLLENGFSLLFAGYYFNDDKIYNKAKEIIIEELNEEILEDGAHFELSPMYHKIILSKLLDCINLIDSNNSYNDEKFKLLLEKKAVFMLGFLNAISFKNNSIPLFNDAAYAIAPENADLFNYASELRIKPSIVELKNSGYRKMIGDEFEFIIDVGAIGPSYQPGHAHADTFSFCLNYKDKPIIVDTGTSTYNIGKRRSIERSTISHNTVTYNGLNSSEVWDGFRVAERANVTILEEDSNIIMAEHDGFKKEGVKHERTFSHVKNSIKIKDKLKGDVTKKSISSIHFHPHVTLHQEQNSIIIDDLLKLSWIGIEKMELKEYLYAPQFNVLEKALKFEGLFESKSELLIEII